MASVVTFSPHSDICSLARTCRLLYVHTSHILYRSVKTNDRPTLSLFAQNHVAGSRVKQVRMVDLIFGLEKTNHDQATSDLIDRFDPQRWADREFDTGTTGTMSYRTKTSEECLVLEDLKDACD